LAVPVTRGAEQLAAIVRDLDTAHISLANLALRQPTLEDVFLALTGHTSAVATPASQAAGVGASAPEQGVYGG